MENLQEQQLPLQLCIIAGMQRGELSDSRNRQAAGNDRHRNEGQIWQRLQALPATLKYSKRHQIIENQVPGPRRHSKPCNDCSNGEDSGFLMDASPPPPGRRGAHGQPEGAARLTQARRAPWPAGAIRPRYCLAALGLSSRSRSV
jgi:hypothetical protein